jgi:hypothetical protein
MLAFIAIIVIVGLTQSRPIKPLASQLPAPSHPLFKPDPDRLLAQSALNLSSEQRTQIQSIESKWLTEKAKLLQAMSGYQPKQGRADQISGNLEGYSELSRTYDTTRRNYWIQACAILNATQRKAVEGEVK